MRILCSAKDSHILSTKNNSVSVFAYVVSIYFTSLCLNDDVKVTKFLTTGPGCTHSLSEQRKITVYYENMLMQYTEIFFSRKI